MDALGITDSESITAISRTLSFLGIGIGTDAAAASRTGLNSDNDDKYVNGIECRLILSLDAKKSEDTAHAEFDFVSKRWHIETAPTRF